jgi:hypothetical protein
MASHVPGARTGQASASLPPRAIASRPRTAGEQEAQRHAR